VAAVRDPGFVLFFTGLGVALYSGRLAVRLGGSLIIRRFLRRVVRGAKWFRT